LEFKGVKKKSLINFNNIKIRFCNHCVINKDIVNKYGNSNKYDQEFFNYLKELSDLSIYY
jgi:hypothetical protein